MPDALGARPPEGREHEDAPGVSVVLPVHNERGAVAETLRALAAALDGYAGPWEIVVVDDASTDGSAEAAEASGVDFRLIRHERNSGYGATLKTGFGAARYGRLAFLDADGSYPPAQLRALLAEADQAEMVVGRRDAYAQRASWARRLGKAILGPLARYIAAARIPDLNSGMRVVSRTLVERYWPLLPDGFSLTTTLTLAALCAGWRVRWVPIDYAQRTGRSKIRPVRDMTNFLILVLRTATYFRPLKIYLPLSALTVCASVAVVLLSKWLTHEVMDVTALFLFIAGLQFLLIGVLADLALKMLGARR